MADVLFQTARNKVLKAYKNAGQDFVAGTKPYKSRGILQFVVDNIVTVGATAGAAGFLVCPKGQVLEFFGYGIGDSVTGSGTGIASAPSANQGDTNLAKARSTNGAEDFVIEGVSFSAGNVRMANRSFVPGGLTPRVEAAVLNASGPLMDPAALVTPPQAQSPFNLENALLEAVAPYTAVEFEWDRGRIIPIGSIDQIPEGGAKSFLRSHGDPRTDDRYKIPEGYLWRRDGQPDCEFITRLTTTSDVVIPFNNVLSFNATRDPLTALQFPGLGLDVTCRVHGLSVKLPSRN